ncbi:MAG: ferritin-like domain-containing protein [Candidatus Hydrogenedentota bacterium]|nr:MAG: ferritin-like domain-containing protein [Candidatus Hydrogenedentota bacterium]
MRQFYAGEMTGLLEGKAILYAPNLEAADFLASQIQDEIRHAKLYAAQILKYQDSQNLKIPRILEIIIAPTSGRLWYEHCFLDKALGELWVYALMLFLIQTLPDPKLKKILYSIAKDEMRHIRFGREQTKKALQQNPKDAKYLWGLYLWQKTAMKILLQSVTYLLKKKKREDLAHQTKLFYNQASQLIEQEIQTLLFQEKPLHPNGKIRSACRFAWRKLVYRRFYKLSM